MQTSNRSFFLRFLGFLRGEGNSRLDLFFITIISGVVLYFIILWLSGQSSSKTTYTGRVVDAQNSSIGIPSAKLILYGSRVLSTETTSRDDGFFTFEVSNEEANKYTRIYISAKDYIPNDFPLNLENTHYSLFKETVPTVFTATPFVLPTLLPTSNPQPTSTVEVAASRTPTLFPSISPQPTPTVKVVASLRPTLVKTRTPIPPKLTPTPAVVVEYPPPTLREPPDGASTGPQTTLKWEPVQGLAEDAAYEVFLTGLTGGKSSLGTTREINWPLLHVDKGVKYIWSVRIRRNDGVYLSDESSQWSFTVRDDPSSIQPPQQEPTDDTGPIFPDPTEAPK